VTLTQEGLRYLTEARTILRLVDEATDDARSASGDLIGKVRISCTAALGVRHVSGALFAIQKSFPGIAIDLSLSDVRIDLVCEAVDLAVRLGPLDDSSMKLKQVGQSHRVLVASRGYLEKNGTPGSVEDLARHQSIRMINVAGSERLRLTDVDGDAKTVRLSGRLTVDHGLAAREAVRQGQGIAACHVWLVDDLLASGEVERVLPTVSLEPVPLSILYVPARARVARVRKVIDELAMRLSAVPGVDVGSRLADPSFS
jgi:DNA-binding transcriptional LysR family regulator